MIEVQVKFYGGLHTRYPDLPLGQTLTCQTQAGATIEQLLAGQLNLPADDVAIALVNGKRQDLTYRLQDGDLLVLFPPIAGG
ncbi:MAG: MoaD/ThiS family protein [Anaerolineae bacterium]